MGLFNKKKPKRSIIGEKKTLYNDPIRGSPSDWEEEVSLVSSQKNNSMAESGDDYKLFKHHIQSEESNSVFTATSIFTNDEDSSSEEEGDGAEGDVEDEEETEKEAHTEEKENDSSDELEFKVFDDDWSLVDECMSCLDERKKERESNQIEPNEKELYASSDEDTELDTSLDEEEDEESLRAENKYLYAELAQEKMRSTKVCQELHLALQTLERCRNDQRRLEQVCSNLTKSSAMLEKKFKVEMSELKSKYKMIQQVMSKCQLQVTAHQESHTVTGIIETASTSHMRSKTDFVNMN